MFNLTKQKLIRLIFYWVVLLPGIPFVLVSIGITSYVYWPRDFSAVSELSVAPDTEYITLSAHGVKDSPASWSDELQQLMAIKPYAQLGKIAQQNHSIDWQRFSNNVFICSVSGKRIGIEIGERLAKQANLNAIHAIGHSCGSFVVLGICEGAKSVNPQIVVQTTYLDPVSVYSGFFWDYGLEHFGSCADFSDNYIDTRDTIPGSNQPLTHAYTFDVTKRQTKADAEFPPHAWPPQFYLNAYKAGNVPIFYKGDPAVLNQFKKGDSEVLK